MKKLLCICLSLICLLSCISCFPTINPEKNPDNKPEPYSVVLNLISSFSSKHYINPSLAFPSPDDKVLYYFYLLPATEGSSEGGIYALAEIDLTSGEEREIFKLDEERFNVYQSPAGAYPKEAGWTGNVFSFVVCGASGTYSKFSVNQNTGEVTEETNVTVLDRTLEYAFLDESEREWAYYEIPEGGRVLDATVANGKLYQRYTLDEKLYYREFDLETKDTTQVDVTGKNAAFYGCFLLWDGKTPGKKDLLQFQNGELVCVAEDLPQKNGSVLLNQFKEFVFTNPGFEKCFYARNGVLHPLNVTLNHQAEGNSSSIFPNGPLYLANYGTTLYYCIGEEVNNVLTYYIYKGTIEPFAVLADDAK